MVPVDLVVARQLRDGTFESDVLCRCRIEEGMSGGLLIAKGGAINGIVTRVESIAYNITVGPSHNKITMVSISSRVTICPSKVCVVISKWARVKEEFVEQ